MRPRTLGLTGIACLGIIAGASADDTLSVGPAAKRDWALWKTLYINGTSFLMPIVGIGGVPVALGVSTSHSTPLINFYVDKASYKRVGDVITFDMVWHVDSDAEHSTLNEDFKIDCATRTFFRPWKLVYNGPMATGEPKWPARKPDMKKPKTSEPGFKAPDFAYFCEGPNHTPLPSAPVGVGTPERSSETAEELTKAAPPQ